MQRNRVGFKVPVFRINDGEMLMEAGYEVETPTRVSITLEKASLVSRFLRSSHHSTCIIQCSCDLSLVTFMGLQDS